MLLRSYEGANVFRLLHNNFHYLKTKLVLGFKVLQNFSLILSVICNIIAANITKSRATNHLTATEVNAIVMQLQTKTNKPLFIKENTIAHY